MAAQNDTASERIRAARVRFEEIDAARTRPGTAYVSAPAPELWYGLMEHNLSRTRNAWKVLSYGTDRDRLADLARAMNETERNPYLVYRTLDYATAVERLRL